MRMERWEQWKTWAVYLNERVNDECVICSRPLSTLEELWKALRSHVSGLVQTPSHLVVLPQYQVTDEVPIFNDSSSSGNTA